MLPEMMTNHFLKGADWDSVKEVAGLRADVQVSAEETISESDMMVAFKRRLLETERQHYWNQFEQGTLGKQATSRLVEAVEHALDGDPVIGPRPELYQAWQTPKLLNQLREIKGLKRIATSFAFDRLAQGYDVARGFIQAQEALAEHIDTLAPNPDAAALVRKEVAQNEQDTLKQIHHLRESFPEIIHALETQAATRLLLNRERALVQHQLKLAVLDKPEAERLVHDVERRMLDLQRRPVLLAIKSDQLVDCMPWSRALCNETKEKLSAMMDQRIYNPDDMVAVQDKPQSAVGVIIRGTVEAKIKQDATVSVTSYGPGETIAVLALLSGRSPATYRAESPVEIIWFSVEKMKVLVNKDGDLARALAALMSA
ncbi:cyclic nucleotide-binding domain-containing protein [Litoribacillus peritrichatus]|uniref:Cyclic nucleotide-binding domain-containing protein n=1 Tax=Litoribacillus peritrichatus TaxID=718191 RepID=A0ABP7ML18_9GAMM